MKGAFKKFFSSLFPVEKQHQTHMEHKEEKKCLTKDKLNEETQYDDVGHEELRRKEAPHEETRHETLQHEHTLHEETQHEESRQERALHERKQDEEIKKESASYEEARPEGKQQEAAKKESVLRKEARYEEKQHEEIKNESVPYEEARHEEKQHETVKKESASYEEVRHEEKEHETVKHESMPHEEARPEGKQQEEVKKESALRKEARYEEKEHETVKNESMPHEEVRHEEKEHETVKKESAPHEEASYEETHEAIQHEAALHEEARHKEDDTNDHMPQRGQKLQPLDEIEGFSVRPGFYNRDGATAASNGISFTIHSFGATECTLLLFRPMEKEPYARLKFPKSYHIGNTYSMLVFGLQMEEFEYAFQLDGPYDREKGLLFNKNHVLLDPYARAVTGQRQWGERPEGGGDFVYHARVVENNFDWGNVRQLEYDLEDLVIYEMHVRGFTKDKSSGVTAKGTYEGLREKIPYLKDLGVNAVELMPIFEFDEMESARVVDGQQLYNYWGYNTVCFFAPNTGYSSVVEHNHEGDELKRMIYELKENGIEVILDVVFNHTAEGNEDGPCFSFKGIDNNIYYILSPDGHYYNFSGCGNVLNCNHPVTRRFIIDCLRYWVTEYRVDGFRFDLASILTRDQNGAPMAEPPILQAIACDSVLGKVKLIAEAWDAAGLYQVGNFPAFRRWSEWNGKYRDDMRRFLKGDEGMAGTAITRITGSKDLYDPSDGRKCASVNFLTCHDGFTLYDLYSYNAKHNEKNGWNNTDGDNNGNNWNCGAEGETEDAEIENLRRRMIKNAFATLMCSRGPAMFFAGDEFCNTQFGNNNAYCQDNEVSWLDWNRLTKYQEIHHFFRYMIAFRKKYAILRKSTKMASCGLPEISIHNGYPWNSGTDYTSRLIGVMYAGRNEEDTRDDIVFYGMNAYWEPLDMQLPQLPENKKWKICVNTFVRYEDGIRLEETTELDYNSKLKIPPRTVVVLVGE